MLFNLEHQSGVWGNFFAMKINQEFWYFVSNIGVKNTYELQEIKRIQITNQLFLIALFSYFIFDISFLSFQLPFYQFDYFITGLFFTIVPWLNFKGFHTAAKLTLCAILYFGVFNIMFFYGKTFESNLLFLPVVQVPFFLFDVKNKDRKFLWISLIVPFAVFLFLNFADFKNPGNLLINTHQYNLMRLFISTFAVLIFFTVVYAYTVLNRKSEIALSSKNTLLEEQLQTIFDNSYDALLLLNDGSVFISAVNRRALEMFEVQNDDELTGQWVQKRQKKAFSNDEVEAILQEIKEKKYWSQEIEFVTETGKTFWGDTTVKSVQAGSLRYQLIRIADVTQRKLNEEKIKSSLREKETLIDEIHHRVKNNLAVISGLLYLQSNQIEDKKLQQTFDESRRRIQSMALVHEKLYHNESLESIDFAEYVKALVESIHNSYNPSAASITVETDITNIYLELKNAVPCGLILNELISNAYKHAFEGKVSGKIGITINKKGSQLSLCVEDNGVGLKDNLDISQSTTLGFTLVNSLIAQVHGILHIENTPGAKFNFTFTE